MPAPAPRDMWMQIRFGQLETSIQADSVSYAPDVADDMVKQLLKAFSEAITVLKSHGVIGDPGDDDWDDDDDEADEDGITE